MRHALSSFDTLRVWHDEYQRGSPAGDLHADFSLLSGTVRVAHVDATGDIEVSGRSVEDVLFGQGYAHCSERLFQMDYSRHRAAGTLAEVFDAAQLPSDKLARTLDLMGLAARDLAAQSTRELSLLQAYSAGVNAFLQEGRPLPLEYRAVGLTDPGQVAPWLPEHSLALLRLHTTALGDSSSEAWQRELTRGLVAAKAGPEQADAWGLGAWSNGSERAGGGGVPGGVPGGVAVLPGASSSVAYVVSARLMQAAAPASSAALVLEVSLGAGMGAWMD